MEMIISGLALISVIASLVCFVMVLIAVFQEEGILWGLFGLICCQIYVFLWGWIKWDNPNKFLVMGIWTVCALFNAGVGVAIRSQGTY